jgi:hypothetical protein
MEKKTMELAASAPSSARRDGWRIVLALAAAGLSALALLGLMPRTASQAELAVRNIRPSTEVLALGASHVFTSIEPTLTERPWTNLSAGLQNYLFMESVWAAHEAKMPALRAVVLDLDPLPVFTDSYASSRGDYDHLLDLEPHLGALHEPWGRKLVLARDRLLTRQLAVRRAFWREKVDAENVLAALRPVPPKYETVPGHERLLGRRPESGAWGERARGHRATVYSSEVIPRNLAAFARLVQGVKARGLRLILVRFPVHPAYLHASPDFDRAYARLHELARRVAPDAEVLDFSSTPAFGDEEFYDDDHLNQRGATRFTPMLSARVEALLRGPQPHAEHH